MVLFTSAPINTSAIFFFFAFKNNFWKNATFLVEPLLADRATILHKTLSHYVAQGKWNVPPLPPKYQINVDNVILKYSTCLGSSQKNTERGGGGKWGEISFSISDSINYFVSCFSNKFCQRLSFASTQLTKSQDNWDKLKTLRIPTGSR